MPSFFEVHPDAPPTARLMVAESEIYELKDRIAGLEGQIEELRLIVKSNAEKSETHGFIAWSALAASIGAFFR